MRKMNLGPFHRVTLSLLLAFGVGVCTPAANGQTTSTAAQKRKRKKHRAAVVAAHSGVAHSTTQAGVIHTAANSGLQPVTLRRRVRHRVFFNPWTEPTFADSTVGDTVAGGGLGARKDAPCAQRPHKGTRAGRA